MLNRAKYFLLLLVVLIGIQPLMAIEEGHQRPFKDYLIILVHGINSTGMTWLKDDMAGGNNRLYSYLTKPVVQGGLGCKGNVFAFSFARKSGLHEQNILELGSSQYDNPGAVVVNKAAGTIQGTAEWLSDDGAANYKGLVLADPDHLAVQKDSNGKGRSWIEQAKYGFKI